MAAFPNTFDYFKRGSPLRSLVGRAATTGFDYLRRRQPFEVMVAAQNANVYDQTVVPAGVVTVGAATAAEIQYNIVAVSGAQAAGAITAVAVYATVGSGSAQSGGSASSAAIFESVSGGSALGGGSASVSSVTGGLVPAGVLVGGAASTAILLASSGGASASGKAEVQIDQPEECYARLGGTADCTVTVAPTRLVYHRFYVGETVYILSVMGRSYLRFRVRGIYIRGTQVYYDFGTERLVPEQYILSAEEYRVEVSQRARPFVREAQRQLSHLREAPLTMLPTYQGAR